MSDPWMKFYTSDWRSDPALRMCSMAARGLWIEMICLMHEATPYGHLLVNGQSLTDTQLAALVGTTPDQITASLGELEAVAVFSRTRAGVIFSRKLTRMAKNAATARNNGRKGGNPSLGNERENKLWDNPSDKPEDKPQKPKAIYQIQDGGGGSAGAREDAPSPDQTDRERILAAMGMGPDGIVGPSKFLGSQADMAQAKRWLEMPSMTLDVVCIEIARITANKLDGPPTSFKYFTPAMQRLSGALSAPPMLPSEAPQARWSPPAKLWNIDPNDFNPDGSLRR